MASERGRNLRGAGPPSYWTLVSLDTLLSGGDGHAERSDHGVGVDHGAAVDRADDPVHAQITCLGHFALGRCALDHQRPHATGGMPETVPHAGSRAPLPRPCPPAPTASSRDRTPTAGTRRGRSRMAIARRPTAGKGAERHLIPHHGG